MRNFRNSRNRTYPTRTRARKKSTRYSCAVAFIDKGLILFDNFRNSILLL